MRFLAVLGVVFLITTTCYLGLYNWGQARTFTEFENEFTRLPKPWILIPSFVDSKLPVVEQGSAIPLLGLSRDENGILRVSPPGFKEARNFSLESESKNFPKFDLKSFSNAKFLAIEIQSYKDQIPEQIAESFDSTWDNRVLILCAYNNIVDRIKELKPMWLVSASQPDVLRWKFYDALGLLPVVNFERDVFVFKPVLANKDLTDSFKKELARRKRIFLLGPLSDQTLRDNNFLGLTDGVILTSPDQTNLLFSKSKSNVNSPSDSPSN